MGEPYVGEIRMFAGNFAPRGYAYADGQLLAVSSNDALFSLYGTIYGGDGRTTFGLPDLRGRVPIHAGSGPGLTTRRLGTKSGQERVTLITNQLPQHTHTLTATTTAGNENSPEGNLLSAGPTLTAYIEADQNTPLSGNSVLAKGGSQSHENMQPFQAIHFIVSLFGLYPSRT